MSLIKNYYGCNHAPIPTNLIVKELVFKYLGSLDVDSYLTNTIIMAAKEATDKANSAAERVENTDVSLLQDAIDSQKLDTGITATPKFGGVARTQFAKNSEVVSINDFGAKAEDGFDSTTAIQAAVNSGAGCIFIPAGNYTKTDNIIIPTGVSLFGVGKLSVIKDTRNTVGEGFTIKGSNISLDGFSLLGAWSGTNTPFVNGSIAIRASNSGVDYDSIYITSLHIDGWGTGGVLLSRCNNSYVRYCRITNLGRYGVFVMGANNTHLIGNTIKNITAGSGGNAPFINAYGFSFTSDVGEAGFPPCINCSALFNYIENIPNWEGMDIHGCEDILIAYNTVKDTMIGCYVGASSGANNRVTKNIVISNNKLSTTTALRRPAIIVSPAYSSEVYGSNIRVSDNTITGYGTSLGTVNAGFTSIEGAIHTVGVIGCQVINNTLLDCNGYGIFIRRNCLGVLVEGNSIRDMKTTSDQNWCIAVEDVTSSIVTLSNNYFQRSTGVVNGITTLNSSSVVVSGTSGLTLGINTFLGITQKYGTYTLKHSNSVSPELLTVKAHGFISNSGTAAITRGVNVANITRAGVGIVDVVYAVPMQSSDSSITVTPKHNTSAYCVVGSITATGFRVYTFNKTDVLEDISFLFSVM